MKTPVLSRSGRITAKKPLFKPRLVVRPTTVKRAASVQKVFHMDGKQLFRGGHADARGRRPTMEDASSSHGEFAGAGTQYYGLFDGHGGREAALFCAQNLHVMIAQEIENGKDVQEAIRQSILEINRKVLAKWEFVGTTAAIAVIVDDVIYTANVGDSRVILIENGKAKRLSFDHKATNSTEKALIMARGGRVYQGRVNGILMVSRAIGDAEIARYITCEPYMTKTPLVEGMKLILACDGVWDVMSDQNAADIFLQRKDPLEAARAIKAESLRRGTMDNVSVMCVELTYKEHIH